MVRRERRARLRRARFLNRVLLCQAMWGRSAGSSCGRTRCAALCSARCALCVCSTLAGSTHPSGVRTQPGPWPPCAQVELDLKGIVYEGTPYNTPTLMTVVAVSGLQPWLQPRLQPALAAGRLVVPPPPHLSERTHTSERPETAADSS